MVKSRTQNPVVGDIVRLSLYTSSSNNRVDVTTNTVNIYFLDPAEVGEENPDGRRLVQQILSDEITKVPDTTGEYYVDVELISDQYVIGQYVDSWDCLYQGQSVTQSNLWEVYANLFTATPTPVVYGFQFRFRPNRLRIGSKQYLVIEVEPDVPYVSDLDNYYLKMATTAPLKIYIQMACVPCMPEESDLRMVIEGEDITYRENCRAYYLLDTTDMDCGEYYVWFEMACGETLHVSDKQVLQIFQ